MAATKRRPGGLWLEPSGGLLLTAVTRSARPEEETKRRLEHHLSEMWPAILPANYEDEGKLYEELRECWETFVDVPDPRYLDVLSTYTLLSYRIRDFHSVGHLYVFGPKDSGKSTILRMFQRLGNLPLLVSSVSPAAVYQSTDRWHPMLLFDEADRLAKEQSEYTTAMLQILNVYCDDEKVVRASRDNGDPIIYDCFCLKIVASTEPLPGTLPDRCVRIDMEHNLNPMPVEIDERVTWKVRRKLERYKVVHDITDYTPSIDIEALNLEINDNRTTQLFYPLYESCPTDKGRRNLLELAKEMVDEKHSDEQAGDLADVLEAVVTSFYFKLATPNAQGEYELPKTVAKALILEAYNQGLEPGQEKATPGWLGWKLKKLQLKSIRLGDKDGTRAVEIQPRKLYRLARRYAPAIARTLTELTETPEHAQTSVNAEETKTPELREHAEASVNSDRSVNSGGTRQPTDRLDIPLIEDYLVKTAVRTEETRIGYGTEQKLRSMVTDRFGESAALLVPKMLRSLCENGHVVESPFKGCYMSTKSGPFKT